MPFYFAKASSFAEASEDKSEERSDDTVPTCAGVAGPRLQTNRIYPGQCVSIRGYSPAE